MTWLTRFRPWFVPAAVGLQIIGLAVWWEAFNAFAFGHGSVMGGIVKFFILSGLLSLWSYQMPKMMSGKFVLDRDAYREKDALAGLPLAGLPLIMLLAKPISAGAKAFSLKLFGYLWMPWWIKSGLISSEAKLVLVISGIFILGAMFGKAFLIIRALHRAPDGSISVKRLLWMGFLLYAMLLSWPACTQTPRAGEVSHWLVTQALALDGAFHVEGVLARADYYQFYPLQKITYKGYTDILGQLFLPVAPGMPLLFITFYLLQGKWLLGLLSMLFAAGAASQLYGFCRERQFSPRISLWVWTIVLLNAPLMIYGYQQTEVAAGAFFLMFTLRRLSRMGNASPAETRNDALLVALAAGLILMGGIRFLVPAGFILLLLVFRLAMGKRMLLGLSAFFVLLAPLAFMGWYYATIYRFFLTHMPYTLHWPWHLNGWLNLTAVFFDRYVGLVWSAPVWVAAMAGMVWLAKSRGTGLAVMLAFPMVCGLVAAMCFPDPWAEGSSFHRFVAPMIPLLGLGLAAFLERLQDRPQWQTRVYWLGLWGAGAALLQTLFPFLAMEAGRLRISLHFQPLGWIYRWLPSFKGRVIMLEVLFGLLLMLAMGYVLYRLTALLLKPQENSSGRQQDEQPKPRIV